MYLTDVVGYLSQVCERGGTVLPCLPESLGKSECQQPDRRGCMRLLGWERNARMNLGGCHRCQKDK